MRVKWSLRGTSSGAMGVLQGKTSWAIFGIAPESESPDAVVDQNHSWRRFGELCGWVGADRPVRPLVTPRAKLK